MEKKAFLLVSLCSLLISCSLVSQNHYTPDLSCCDITEEILDLKIETARKNIHTQLTANPNNYYFYYLDQFADFVQLLVAANEEKYEEIKDNYDKYREIMDDKDTTSPYYLFILSSMQLQLSLTKLKFGDNLSGANLALKSYRNMERNTEKHPGFYGNKKLRGLFNVLLGNTPSFLRTLAGIFGMKAGKESTYDLLSAYKEDISDKPGISAEANIFIALSLLLDKEIDQAYQFISSLNEKETKVFLLKYFYGNLAYKTGENEKALEVFRDLNIDSLEVNFYPYYFLYGKMLLNKLDPSASIFLETYVKETNGIDYLKQAHLLLAYCHLMDGDMPGYETELSQVKKQGKDKTDRDREALLDLKRGYTPDTTLLAASFLIKGRYFQMADSVLTTYPIINNIFLPYKLDYLLLKAQIQNGYVNYEAAIPLYKSVIEYGENENEDFATIAAIKLAQIYESQDDSLQALQFYELAKSLYKSDYYESLEDLALKGIERIENQAVTNE